MCAMFTYVVEELRHPFCFSPSRRLYQKKTCPSDWPRVTSTTYHRCIFPRAVDVYRLQAISVPRNEYNFSEFRRHSFPRWETVCTVEVLFLMRTCFESHDRKD